MSCSNPPSTVVQEVPGKIMSLSISQASSPPPSRPLPVGARLGARGIKRQGIGGRAPPNTKRSKTNKGGKGQKRTLTKVGERVKFKGRTADSGAARKSAQADGP